MTNAQFLPLGLDVPKKPSKMPSGTLPGPPPGGGQIDPKRAQDTQRGPKDGPKSRPCNFPSPPFPPRAPSSGPPGAQDAPEGSGSPSGTPRGAKFDPRGFLFWTPGRRVFNPLRAPFPRRWGHTVPTMFSTPGPAECAKRLNNDRKQISIY